MLWYELLIHYLGTLIGLFVIVGMYNCLFDSKKLTIKDILIICGFSVLSTANTLTNYTFSKIPIFYLLYISCLWLIFKDNIKKIMISGLLIYLVIMFVEVLFSIIMVLFPFENIEEVNDNPTYKFLISSLIMILSIMTFYIKKVRFLFVKVIEFLKETKKNIEELAIKYIPDKPTKKVPKKEITVSPTINMILSTYYKGTAMEGVTR